MYYLCTLLFIINQWKETLQYSALLHVIQPLYLLSIFLVHACENYHVARSTSHSSYLHQDSISTWYQSCNFYNDNLIQQFIYNFDKYDIYKCCFTHTYPHNMPHRGGYSLAILHIMALLDFIQEEGSL